MRVSAIFLLLCLIQGCTSGFYEIKYRPLTKNESAYSLIGTECELIDTWYLIGSENFDNNGVIDSYILKDTDQFFSRHIKDKIELEQKTRVEIVSVERNVNWRFIDNTYKLNLRINDLKVKAHFVENIEALKSANYDFCSTFN